jgi:multiple sugar transport system substrate-binding protein
MTEIRLKGMTWNHPRGLDPMLATSAAYQARNPAVTIEWEARSLQDFEHFPLDQLAAAYDLMVVDHPHCGMAAASGCILPLDRVVEPAVLAALGEGSIGRSHQSYAYAGHHWALAIDAAAQTALYRPDEIVPPRRWSAVEELARAGRVLLPLRTPHPLMNLMTLAGNLAHPCGRDGLFVEPAIGRIVLEALQAVVAHLPQECFGFDPIQVSERMAADPRHAYSPLIYGYSSYARQGFRPVRLGFADIPSLGDGGPLGSILGGTGIALSALREAHREVALDYALWIAGPDCQAGLYVEAGGQPAHPAAWADPEADRLLGGFLTATRATMDGAEIRPRVDGWIDFQAEAGSRIAAFHSGGIGAEALLSWLNDGYARLAAGRGAGSISAAR